MTADKERPSSPEAGWYPDPSQVDTQRFWDGESWTEQRAPAVAAESSKTVGAASLDRNLGAVLTFVGAAALLVSVFLPMADSSEFLRVVDNSLIQHDEGWAFIVLAICAAGGGYQAYHGQGRAWALLAIGGIALALAIYIAQSDALTLTSAASTRGMSLGEALTTMSRTEKASPGIGIYAAGLGGLLVAIGGWLLRPPKTAAAA